MSNENIIREIDEELRSDRARKLWRSFGPFVIGAAVVVVLAVAVNEGWSWWQNSNSAQSSDQFYSALEAADGADVAAAQKALDGVIAAGHGGYPTLARFREAALLAQDGKAPEAIAAYDAISTSESNKYLRELALVLAANLLVDSGDVAQVEQRVGGLTGPASTFRNAANEVIGLAKYKAGDLAGARTSFEQAANDGLTSTEARARLNIYLAQLTAEGAAPAPVAAAEAPAAADPAPAETSVGDAPVIDTAPSADAPAMAPATEAPAADAPAADAPAPAAPAN
ncbi:tetratricopeptide repeat protein [Devosia sp. ZB163]|uniref:tetratricopeptide repeat protein n=1 Tax=Devosia sp. ZB163 TaxID=3025938 RepID=UPI00235F3A47|nr:tetratricopeptide repeat protein [Devosia sp. ZB163]MDC9824009.1 tetratricopeptide repeat protein [Devosia sp. ZB163]